MSRPSFTGGLSKADRAQDLATVGWDFEVIEPTGTVAADARPVSRAFQSVTKTVTTIVNSTGFRLPPGKAGMRKFILNLNVSGFTVFVYPAAGDALIGTSVAVDGQTRISGSGIIEFLCLGPMETFNPPVQRMLWVALGHPLLIGSSGQSWQVPMSLQNTSAACSFFNFQSQFISSWGAYNTEKFAALAATGATQGTAADGGNARFSKITAGAADTGIKLRAVAVNTPQTIWNATASTKKIYPASGEKFVSYGGYDVGADAAIILEPGNIVTLENWVAGVTNYRFPTNSKPITNADPEVGHATLVAGTVTVPTTAVTAASEIQLTHRGTGTPALFGTLYKGAVVAGTSFVINSTNVADDDSVSWEFKN
jgi:hypothetical protein